MQIQFTNPTDVVVVTEKKVTIEKLTINELVDLPTRKMVVAKTSEVGTIILWKDADYDAIGQWTDTDVIARISELYNA
jgi:hypothetical protein